MRYRRLDTLSGGERQRAWLAMAIAQNPEILLLDEPTTYLDVKHQLDLMNLVYKLYETRKITVIMVLHDLNHAARYSHRLVAVKKGKIFAEGLVQDVFTEKILCDLYDVETSVMSLEQNGQKHLVCFPYDVKQGEKN
jgi:iron complex transport system ATP-binding protein